ncbi:DegQ family serine endoprotease [Agrobacterium tumefaciens]|uniref:DegQ family serine endoprotease n=1 Tax=Agrobacterium tumefaciens TaxID=358 RepID=UPI00287C61CC|nr:DegQ family serine endoprotease [Agrobacterium tumefaciens]MDS7593931.1 DegQ family serine endoprotease [Agrobacterium tumefaciens]
MSNIIHRNRILALVGAAIIAVPLATPFIVGGSSAFAGPSTAPAVAGIVAPAGSFASIVAADKPAVVTITTTMKAEPVTAPGTSPFGEDSPFNEQFRQFFGQQGIPMPRQAPEQPQSQRAQALGSGFIISPDGYIVTNNHVIDKAMNIKVTLDDGTELPATLIGADPKSDLAVVKVEAKKPLPTVAWGDSDRLKLGDLILAIGNPFGIGTTVTAGIVSARGRDLHSGPYDDFIQIDAPINHGNSGGPLVDGDGKVVGINTAIYSPNGGSVGVGFAIPSDQAQAIVAKLIKSGSIEHGFIGVQIQPVTADVANAIGLDKPEGALVASVNEDTPAAKAGIKTGDVITAVGGKPISSPRDLSRMVADLAPGDREAFTIWRQGASKDLRLTIGESGQEQQASADTGKDASAAEKVPTIGIGLADITDDIRQALNLPAQEKGAIIESVAPDKPAADAGLQAGDIIVSVNQQTVKSAAEAKTAVADAGKAGRKAVLLLIQRGDTKSFITVPFSIG